jgi:hypothetical protein
VSWEQLVQAIARGPAMVLPLAVERGGTRLGIEVLPDRRPRTARASAASAPRRAYRRGRRPHRGDV